MHCTAQFVAILEKQLYLAIKTMMKIMIIYQLESGSIFYNFIAMHIINLYE